MSGQGCSVGQVRPLLPSAALLQSEEEGMATRTTIEWTEMTWNPVTGCTKVSPGCKHCYAETMARRLVAMKSPRYRDGFKLALQEDLVDLPRRWRAPRTIFVNSMSDLFHEDVPA